MSLSAESFLYYIATPAVGAGTIGLGGKIIHNLRRENRLLEERDRIADLLPELDGKVRYWQGLENRTPVLDKIAINSIGLIVRDVTEALGGRFVDTFRLPEHPDAPQSRFRRQSPRFMHVESSVDGHDLSLRRTLYHGKPSRKKETTGDHVISHDSVTLTLVGSEWTPVAVEHQGKGDFSYAFPEDKITPQALRRVADATLRLGGTAHWRLHARYMYLLGAPPAQEF